MPKCNRPLNNQVSDYMRNSACPQNQSECVMTILQEIEREHMMTWNSLMVQWWEVQCLIYSQTDNTDCHNKHFLLCVQTQTIGFGQELWDGERGKKKDNDLFRPPQICWTPRWWMAGVFSSPRWVSFLSQGRTGRWLLPASEHNIESSNHQTRRHQVPPHVRHQVPPHVDIYLFLRLFRLLFLCLFLACGRRAVLLAENVAVLIVLREQIDGFLGSDFLLLGCKNKGIKAVRSARASAGMDLHLPGFFWFLPLKKSSSPSSSSNRPPPPTLPPAGTCLTAVGVPSSLLPTESESFRAPNRLLSGERRGSGWWRKAKEGKKCQRSSEADTWQNWYCTRENLLSSSVRILNRKEIFTVFPSAFSFLRSTGFLAHVSSGGAPYLHSSGFHCGLFSLQPPEVLAPQRKGHPGKYVRRHGLKC